MFFVALAVGRAFGEELGAGIIEQFSPDPF